MDMEIATESGNRNRPMCISNTPTRAGKLSPIICVDLRLLFGELGGGEVEGEWIEDLDNDEPAPTGY